MDINPDVKDHQTNLKKNETIDMSVTIGLHRNRYSKDWCRREKIPNVRHGAILHLIIVGANLKCEPVMIKTVVRNGSRVMGGGYKRLADGELDIYMEPVYDRLIFQNISFLYPHEKADVCLSVRRSPLVHRSVLLSMSQYIWLSTAVCVGIFVAGARIGINLSVGLAVLHVVRALITGAFEPRLRCLMVWMSLLSFFLWNSIGGSFTDVNARVQIVHVPKWFKSQIEHVSGFGGTLALLMGKLTTQTLPTDFDSWAGRALLAPAFSLTLSERQLCAAMGRCVVFHRVRQCVLSPTYMSFAIRREWPLADRFSNWLQRVVEAGLADKAVDAEMRYGLRSAYFQCRTGNAQEVPEAARILKLADVCETFWLWTVGTCVAVVAFCGEKWRCVLRCSRTSSGSEGRSSAKSSFCVFQKSRKKFLSL
ncbi:Ionotropic receptor 884 [Gryllus bimaculatus]|nr:Ionotropic receptor 884 [Gryllus bimaculatus]